MSDTDTHKLLASNRVGDRINNLYDDLNCQEQYADGVGVMFIGPSVSRISMFKTTELTQQDGVGIENRHVNIKIILPTPALIEWAANLLSSVVQNEDAISNTNDVAVQSIKQAVDLIIASKKP